MKQWCTSYFTCKRWADDVILSGHLLLLKQKEAARIHGSTNQRFAAWIPKGISGWLSAFDVVLRTAAKRWLQYLICMFSSTSATLDWTGRTAGLPDVFKVTYLDRVQISANFNIYSFHYIKESGWEHPGPCTRRQSESCNIHQDIGRCLSRSSVSSQRQF